MKFGKLVQNFQAEFEEEGSLPHLLDYKKLKKRLKALTGAPSGLDGAGAVGEAGKVHATLSAEAERQFITELNEDVSRINEYFMQREEEAVIRLQALQDRVGTAMVGRELSALHQALIDFHGEMVLLLHWCLVNYAAVAKILKKHDKMTGCLLRAPYLSNVLHQPFLSTESISRLVRQAEALVQSLSAEAGADVAAAEEGRVQGLPASGVAANVLPQPQPQLVKRTRAALGMLRELQEKAHTPSTLLPPHTAAAAAGKGGAAAAGAAGAGEQAAAGPAAAAAPGAAAAAAAAGGEPAAKRQRGTAAAAAVDCTGADAVAR